MNITVIFESMFGATRHVAEEIAAGLGPYGVVTIANVNEPTGLDSTASADLLVIGGPTHVHGMSRPASREEARTWAADKARNLTLEPLAPGTGVREWIDQLPRVPALFAAFDTRMDVARVLSGAASGRIHHALDKRGSRSVMPSVSFLVSTKGLLEEGELDRARVWGADIGAALRDHTTASERT